MSGTAPPTGASRVTEWGPIVVTVLVMLIFEAAIVVAWLTKEASLSILLGMAGGNAATAVGYWLGSSKGSDKKTDIMAGRQ